MRKTFQCKELEEGKKQTKNDGTRISHSVPSENTSLNYTFEFLDIFLFLTNKKSQSIRRIFQHLNVFFYQFSPLIFFSLCLFDIKKNYIYCISQKKTTNNSVCSFFLFFLVLSSFHCDHNTESNLSTTSRLTPFPLLLPS